MEKVDIFHAHDWLVANAGISLKQVFRKLLIAIFHSTQVGRNGAECVHERTIHETEYWLTYES